MKRLFILAFVSLVALSSSAQFGVTKGDVPAYNAQAPTKDQHLPAIMSGMQLTGTDFQHPVQVLAYKSAAKIPNVLHQLPCYCYCDRSAGHNSLHSCFETVHGAHCATCMKEAIFAEQMTRQGKTPQQIRAAIEAGAFDKLDLAKLDAQK